MRKLILLSFMILAPLSVHAEGEKAPVAPVAKSAPSQQEIEAELHRVLHVDDSVSMVGLIESAKKTYNQAKSAKQSKEATEIALALSSFLFLVLAGARRFIGADKLSGNSVRITCLITGSIASLLGYYGGGFGAVESLQLFMAGIGSMAINETIKIAKPKNETKGNLA